jgi:uncharacterized protein YbjQ (UPF0145 family)
MAPPTRELRIGAGISRRFCGDDGFYSGYTARKWCLEEDIMAVNPMVDPSMVTTALELPGFRIVRNFGVVRGIVVRSRSIFGTIGAGLQTLAGGNISLYSDLCEKTREDAFELMMQHAAQHGANAIICARYDANDIQQGVTEVLAYGTAVTVERIS